MTPPRTYKYDTSSRSKHKYITQAQKPPLMTPPSSLSQSAIFLLHKSRAPGKRSLSVTSKSRHWDENRKWPEQKGTVQRIGQSYFLRLVSLVLASKIKGRQKGGGLISAQDSAGVLVVGAQDLVSKAHWSVLVSKIWGCRWGFSCPWTRQWSRRLSGCQPVPGPPTNHTPPCHVLWCTMVHIYHVPWYTRLNCTITILKLSLHRPLHLSVNTLKPPISPLAQIDVHFWYWGDLKPSHPGSTQSWIYKPQILKRKVIYFRGENYC